MCAVIDAPMPPVGPTSAYTANAEAPHSRLRVFFAKSGPLRFIGHLDFLRNLPRLFRRARIEVGFSRGFNPVPRLWLGPALALGIAQRYIHPDKAIIVVVGTADAADKARQTAETKAFNDGIAEVAKLWTSIVLEHNKAS